MKQNQAPKIEFGKALTDDFSVEKTLSNYAQKRNNEHDRVVIVFDSMPSSGYSEFLPHNWNRRCQNLENCATFLQFQQLPKGKNTNGHQYKLYRGNFCKERLCPICAHNKSLRNFHIISEVTQRLREELAKEGKQLRLVFVTLTIPNCYGENLHACLKLLFKSLNNLRRRKKFKNLDRYGGFKKFEVTFNRDTWSFNAHLHLLVYTDEEYFSSKDYLHTDELSKIWTECVNTARKWFLENTAHLEKEIVDWQSYIAHLPNQVWLQKELEKLEANNEIGSGYKSNQREKLYFAFQEKESEATLPERNKLELTSFLEKGNNDQQILYSIQEGYFTEFDEENLVCYIEAVPKDETGNATAELSKYVVKPEDCIPSKSEEAQYVVFWLDRALFHQQTENFWGRAFEIAQVVIAEEKDNLSQEDEEVAELILLTYVWSSNHNYRRLYLKPA